MHPRRIGPAALLIVLALNALIYLFLVADHRFPRATGTRTLYETQRATLSGAGDLVAPPGLLAKALRPLSPWTGPLNALPLFHAGMFLDEALFILGVGLLAGRYFASRRTVFVVLAGAAGSSLWMDHAGANFHSIQGVPLALHLIHGFLESGARRNLLFAANLLALQGTASSAVATVLYLACHAALRPGDAAARLAALRVRAVDGIWGLALVASLAPLLCRAGGIPAGSHRPSAEYLDLLMGVAPSTHTTVFCGFFTLALALRAFQGCGRRRAFLLLGMALAAFGILSLVGPAAPWVRLVLVFLSGLGFERAVHDPQGGRRIAEGMLFLGTALMLVALGMVEYLLPQAAAVRGFLGPAPDDLGITDLQQLRLLSELLGMAAASAGVAGIVLWLQAARRRAAPLAVALILMLHPTDVFGWKSRMTWLRSAPLTPAQYESQKLQAPAGERPSPGPLQRAASIVVALSSAAWLGALAWACAREARRRPGVRVRA